MEFTEHYSLIKPAAADYYDIQDFNENMDTIDTQMAQAESQMGNISDKIGSPENGETLFSLLKGGTQGLIKSIQRVFYKNSTHTGESVAINEVDETKCIVLFERLKDTGTGLTNVDYALSKNELTITHTSSAENSVAFGFWIVEFY